MDDWGRDPAVQLMRKVFGGMETVQQDLLTELDIFPYDLRIRVWREKALALFEKGWGIAGQMGVRMDQDSAPLLYTHCLARVMAAEGIEIPERLLPEVTGTERLFKEVFS